MKQSQKLPKRVIALLVSVMMLLSMVPVSIFAVFASDTTSIGTDIDTQTYYVGVEKGFTYTSNVSAENVGKTVIASFKLLDADDNDVMPTAVDTLLYWGITEEEWLPLSGSTFGPATGFPFTDGLTSQFKVKFKASGTYYAQVDMIDLSDDSVIVSSRKAITVKGTAAEMTSDITTKSFEINEEVDFTYTSIPNDLAGEMVLGTFSLLDSEGNEAENDVTLKYLDVSDNAYKEFYGDFGPATTGFPMTNTTSKFKVTFNKTGTYTVNSSIVRFGNREVLCVNNATIEVKDTKKPVISEVTGNATVWTNNDIVLTVNATDNSGSVASYRIKKPTDETWGEWQTNNQFTVTENASYLFQARDASGNESETASVNVEMIDKTAPTVSVSYDSNAIKPDNTWTNSEITVTMTANDEGGSGIKEYIVDGIAQSDNTFKVRDTNEHRVQVRDNAENTSAEINFTANYDDTAPVVSSIDGNPAEWTKNDVTLTVNATDVGSNSIQYKLNNGGWQSENSFTVTENGTYYIYAKDAAGNETAANEVIVTKIDKTAPTISNYTSTTEEWTNENVVISGIFADNSNDTITAYYKVGDGEWKPIALTDNKLEKSVENECNTTYTFKAVDKAGNEFETTAKTVKIDKTPAALTANAISSAWKNEQVTITGTVSDAASGIKSAKYSNGNGDEGDVTVVGTDYSLTTNVATGSYTYTITVEDNAGNITTVDTDIVNIDLTAPTVDSVSPSVTGWTNQAVTVTVGVSDANSGISRVYYKKGDTETEILNNDGVYSFVIPNTANDNAEYKIYCVDIAGNESSESTYKPYIDVTSPLVPVIKYNTRFVDTFLQTITFGLYKAPVTVTITATDDLSGIKEVKYFKGETEITATPVDGKIEFTVSENFKGKITAIAYDNAGNNSDEQNKSYDIDNTEADGIIVDLADPEVTELNANAEWINEKIIVTGKVTDNLSGVKKVYWRQGDDTAEKEVTLNGDGTFEFSIAKQDYKGNIYVGCYDYTTRKATEKSIEVKMDITNPVVDTINASATSWTNGDIVISGTVSDNLAGLRNVYWRKGDDITENVATLNADGTYKIILAAQDYEGRIYVGCYDNASNKATEKYVEVKMDITNPVVDTINASATIWTNGDVVISGTVSDNLSGVKNVYWRQSSDTTENAATLNADGTYTFTVEKQNFTGIIYVGCYDNTGNKAVEKNVSVYMDTTKPVVESGTAVLSRWTNEKVVVTGTVSDATVNGAVSNVATVKFVYDNKSAATATLNGNDYTFEIPRTDYDGYVTIHCVDNAGNESVPYTVKVYMDITKPVILSGAANPNVWTSNEVVISGNLTDITKNNSVSEIKEVKYKYNNGSELSASFANGTYTITVPKTNYKGNVTVWCIDNAGNVSDEYNVGVKMDITVPTNVTITYDTSVLNKLLETITFGFYKSDVKVKITAKDNMALEKIKYNIEGVKGKFDSTAVVKTETVNVTSINKNAVGDIVEGYIEFTVSPEYKGKISAVAYDCAGNNTAKETNNTDNKHSQVIVDNVAPQISVTYSKDDATKVQKVDDTYYFDGKVTANIEVAENNFFEGANTDNSEKVHNLGIKVTKTDNVGNKTVIEYKPTGTSNKYTADETFEFDWMHSGIKHTFAFDMVDDADYQLEIEYKDFSNNLAGIIDSNEVAGTAEGTYKSNIITVDNITPIVTVVYDNNTVINTINGRQYFDANRTATITVVEHNFRESDFVNTIVAKDVTGDDVEGSVVEAWTHDGDKHTAIIKFHNDANYSYDCEFKDLAQRNATDYTENVFTVDKVNPYNLTVTYKGEVKETIVDKLLNILTFGYYDAKVTVEITADDDTAGIDNFVYSYLKSVGVSDVNDELANQTIESAAITQNGKTFTASFEIPKEALVKTNQFNGTVKFTATDRSARATDHQETETIIIDNIKPIATVTYNDPVQKVNDISYYSGNIDAKLVIDEANFYSEDVKVSVTKDGVNYPVSVKWVNDSVDIHTGAFTLTEDGDYIVTVEYADRSANAIEKYTSNRLTIDTKAPTITLSNVKQNSANTDEKYSFTITAKDINLDASSFKPTLTAVVRNENGTFASKTISLGDMVTVENGKEYSFSVDNLDEDAIYSFTATVKDMSDNQYSKIILSDNQELDLVRFSINRDGSTYAVDNNTMDIVEKYYVQKVLNNVVIEEVNADTLGEYKVTLNGKELVKDTDYTVSETGGDNEWKKYTYSVSKALFDNEGEYKVVVSSKDKAENDAFSDVKGVTVNFVVDKTAPIVTVTGLANDGRYQVEKQKVTLIPTDDGGALNTLLVKFVDKDGKEIKEVINLSGDQLIEALDAGEGKITFEIEEGLYQNVRILCNDCAVDEKGDTNTYDETFTNVSVSTSAFMIFWATKPLRYGSIAGVSIIGAAAIAFVFFKKRKIK